MAEWPFIAGNFQWRAEDRNRFPLYQSALNAGITLSDGWFGEFPQQPINNYGEDLEAVVDMINLALPKMRVNRQLFNQWCFDTGSNDYVEPEAKVFIEKMLDTGWEFVWVLMDGPSQRSMTGEPGAGTFWSSYPLLSDIQEDPEGQLEATMDKIHASQMTSWTKFLDYLLERPELYDATIGFELINEPATYRDYANLLGSVEPLMEYYVQHNLAMYDLIMEKFPNDTKDIYVGGWAYSADLNIFYNTLIDNNRISAAEEMRDYIGHEKFVWSLHKYPQWLGRNVIHMDEVVPQVKELCSIPMKQGHRIFLSETQGRNEEVNNISNEETTRNGLLMSRCEELYRKHSMSMAWFPVMNTAASSFMNIHDFDGFELHHQNSLMLFYNVAAMGNNSNYFTDNAGGYKTPEKIFVNRGLKNARSDPDFDVDAKYDSVDYYSIGFGGKGLCVLEGLEDANNFFYGGDGRNILYGSTSNDDFLSLGRGGGVIRLGSGTTYANTNGGRNTIYAGSGWCLVTPFYGINTIIVDPVGETHIIGFNPLRGDRLSFKGFFNDSLEMYNNLHTELDPFEKEENIVIDLDGGGTLTIHNGKSHETNLENYVLDFTDGWYGVGWNEPEDFDPEDFDKPFVPVEDEITSTNFMRDRFGNPISIYNRHGMTIMSGEQTQVSPLDLDLYDVITVNGQSLTLGGTFQDVPNIPEFLNRSYSWQIADLKRADASHVVIGVLGARSQAYDYLVRPTDLKPLNWDLQSQNKFSSVAAPSVGSLNDYRRDLLSPLTTLVSTSHGYSGAPWHRIDKDPMTGPDEITTVWDNLEYWYEQIKRIADNNNKRIRCKYHLLVHGTSASNEYSPVYYNFLNQYAEDFQQVLIDNDIPGEGKLVITQSAGFANIPKNNTPWDVCLDQLQYCMEGKGVLAGPLYPFPIGDNRVHPDGETTVHFSEMFSKAISEIEAGGNWTTLGPLRHEVDGNKVTIFLDARSDENLTFHDPSKYNGEGIDGNYGFETEGANIVSITLNKDSVEITCDGVPSKILYAMQVQDVRSFEDNQYTAHRGLLRTDYQWTSKWYGIPLYRWVPSFTVEI